MAPEILVAVLFALPGFRAEAARPKAPPDILIFLSDRAAAPGAMVTEALYNVARTFARMGISVDWRNGKVKPGRVADATFPIQVRIENGAQNQRRMVVGYCDPFSLDTGSVWIRYDLVRALVQGRRDLEPVLLGHILSHEIGHVLEGTDEHARTGIMKPYWTPTECQSMRNKPLEFTADDIEKIRRGLSARQKRRAALHPPTPPDDDWE